MKYSIKKLNINNIDVYEENKLSPRSYFIPSKNKNKLAKTDALNNRYKSDTVKVISGQWDFYFINKISQLPAEIDTDTLPFDKNKHKNKKITLPHPTK